MQRPSAPRLPLRQDANCRLGGIGLIAETVPGDALALRRIIGQPDRRSKRPKTDGCKTNRTKHRPATSLGLLRPWPVIAPDGTALPWRLSTARRRGRRLETGALSRARSSPCSILGAQRHFLPVDCRPVPCLDERMLSDSSFNQCTVVRRRTAAGTVDCMWGAGVLGSGSLAGVGIAVRYWHVDVTAADRNAAIPIATGVEHMFNHLTRRR